MPQTKKAITFPTKGAALPLVLEPEKETGRNVDGVFGVNMYLAQDLLESIGEINLVDFNEKINALIIRASSNKKINYD